eukprot:scaffold88753_cov45-Phaeocystis_antarctica.AAC.1
MKPGSRTGNVTSADRAFDQHGGSLGRRVVSISHIRPRRAFLPNVGCPLLISYVLGKVQAGGLTVAADPRAAP